MREVKGFHGEWNMGSPGGWEYQRIAQLFWIAVNASGRAVVDHPQIDLLRDANGVLNVSNSCATCGSVK